MPGPGGYFPTVFREGSQINVTLSKDWLLLGEEWSIRWPQRVQGPRVVDHWACTESGREASVAEAGRAGLL